MPKSVSCTGRAHSAFLVCVTATFFLFCLCGSAAPQVAAPVGEIPVSRGTATTRAEMQAAPPPPSTQLPPEHQCPGLFPGDLTLHNCAYSQRQRTVDWVSTSFSDQEILTSAASGFGGFVFGSPAEWPRTSLGFAERWRASYFSGMSNGTAQFILNSTFNLDPRHVSCTADQFIHGQRMGIFDPDVELSCSGAHRVLHILEDTLMTRRSSLDGKKPLRWPSARLIGAFAGAYGESPWEPEAENTPTAILTRAGESLIVPLIGSVLNEFPSALSGLTKPLHTTKPLPKRPSEVPQ